jgi:hypothetical protein
MEVKNTNTKPDNNNEIQYVVLDLHGIIFANINDFGIRQGGMKFLEELDKGNSSTKSIYDSLIAIHKDKFEKMLNSYQDKESTELFYYPSAINAVNWLFAPNKKLIVLSSSGIKVIRYIVENFIKNYAPTYPISKVDIYDARHWGDKRESKTWKMILEKYPQIDYIFDDKANNLHAAQAAANELGFKTECFQTLSEFNFN